MRNHIFFIIVFIISSLSAIAQTPSKGKEQPKTTDTKKPNNQTPPKPATTDTKKPANQAAPKPASPNTQKPANQNATKPATTNQKPATNAPKPNPTPPPKSAETYTQKGINLEKVNLAVALETGIPVFHMYHSSAITAGASFHIDYPISKRFTVGTLLSYQWFSSKAKEPKPAYYLNFFAKGSYFINEKIHLDAAFGYAKFNGTYSANFFLSERPFSMTGIGGSAGIGYRLNKTIDLSTRFQLSKTVMFAGIRLAYIFVGPVMK